MALWHFMAMPGNEHFQWGGTNRARNGHGSSWSMQHPQPVTLSASSGWIFWMAKPYVSKPVIGLLSNMSFPEWMLFWMYHLCWQTWWHFGNIEKTLPRAQRTQGIEYFDSFNTFSLMQKSQQALNLGQTSPLVLFGKWREIQRTTLTNPCRSFTKSI